MCIYNPLHKHYEIINIHPHIHIVKDYSPPRMFIQYKYNVNFSIKQNSSNVYIIYNYCGNIIKC